MTTYTWPTNDPDAFRLNSIIWKVRTLSLESESPLNGDVQTNSRPGSRWAAVLEIPAQSYAARSRLMAFLMRLNGRQHRISFVDQVSPQPRGTIALSGVTLNANAAQFAQTLQLANCGAGTTLLAFDWIKVGTQALRVAANATANGSGVMTVEVRHMLRAAVTAGVAVQTENVAALYILDGSEIAAGFAANNRGDPFAIDIVEVFS